MRQVGSDVEEIIRRYDGEAFLPEAVDNIKSQDFTLSFPCLPKKFLD